MPNNIGAFGENFPYTNFHELNLDAIVKKTNECVEKVTEFTPLVEKLQNDVDHINDTITETINTAVEEQVPEAIEEEIQTGGFDRLLEESRVRRFVFIGDSYAEGYTPDGNVTGFPELVKTHLGIATENFYNFYHGGARFGSPSGSEYAFDTVLSNNLSSITHKETITDIVFAGGYNDYGTQYADISEGINRCKTIIASYFTNPSLKVHLFAIGYNCLSPSTRSKLHKRYAYLYASSGWAFHHITRAICNQNMWASDGYHPIQTGQNAIASAIENYLLGGTSCQNAFTIDYGQTGHNGLVLCTQMFDGFFASFMYGSILPQNNITLNSTTPATIATITTNVPLCNNEDETTVRKYNLQAIAKTSDNTYRNIHLVLHFEQTGRNTFALKALIYNLNDANNNYMSLTNVTEIQAITNSMQFIIPFEF